MDLLKQQQTVALGDDDASLSGIMIVTAIVAKVISQHVDRDMSQGSQHFAAFLAVANSLANELAVDNPRFDRQRFLSACGIEI